MHKQNLHEARNTHQPVIRKTILLAAFAASINLIGCSSTTPVAYQGLSSAPMLQPVKDDDKPFQYKPANVSLRNYTSVFIDPVIVYSGSDAQFDDLSGEDKKIIADYMQKKFSEILAEKYALAQAPKQGTLRIRLTLTGVETSTPVLSTVSHVTPFGLVANVGLQAAGSNGTAFGSATYAVELYDAATGKILYAYISKQTPDALDITASIGYLDAAKTSIRIGAHHLQDDLSQKGLPEINKPEGGHL